MRRVKVCMYYENNNNNSNIHNKEDNLVLSHRFFQTTFSYLCQFEVCVPKLSFEMFDFFRTRFAQMNLLLLTGNPVNAEKCTWIHSSELDQPVYGYNGFPARLLLGHRRTICNQANSDFPLMLITSRLLLDILHIWPCNLS